MRKTDLHGNGAKKKPKKQKTTYQVCPKRKLSSQVNDSLVNNEVVCFVCAMKSWILEWEGKREGCGQNHIKEMNIYYFGALSVAEKCFWDMCFSKLATVFATSWTEFWSWSITSVGLRWQSWWHIIAEKCLRRWVYQRPWIFCLPCSWIHLWGPSFVAMPVVTMQQKGTALRLDTVSFPPFQCGLSLKATSWDPELNPFTSWDPEPKLIHGLWEW